MQIELAKVKAFSDVACEVGTSQETLGEEPAKFEESAEHHILQYKLYR